MKFGFYYDLYHPFVNKYLKINMKITFTTICFLFLFIFKFNISLSQCPTTGLPTTTVKGKFEVDFNGVKYQGDGTLPKITLCTNSTFTVANRSGLTGILYYFQPSRPAFPTPPRAPQASSA